jgi:hypothetical protein
MSEDEKAIEGYHKLKNLTENEIGSLLHRTGKIKNPSQLTSVDFYLLSQGKYTKTLLDLRPTALSEDYDFLDNSKGKIKLKVLADGKIVTGIRYRCNAIKIPDVFAKYELSESDKKELTEKGFLKDRVELQSEHGHAYKAFLSIDKDMNSLVSMPISRLNVASNVLGKDNPLTDDQLKSLRNGYPIAYFGYSDKEGNKSNKTVGIDRINGIIQVSNMKSGLKSSIELVPKENNIEQSVARKRTKSKGV